MSHVEHCIANRSGLRTSFAAPLCMAYHGVSRTRIVMKRHLYVDGTEVAVHADFVGGVQTTGCLYIGAGQALDETTFFSGLIDDIGIYDVALSAEEIAALTQ